MSLTEYLHVVRKRWRTLLVVALTCIAAAWAISAVTPPTYSAQATCFVSIAGAGDSDRQDSVYQNSQFAITRVESYPRVASSPAVLDEVIDRLSLEDTSVADLDQAVEVVNPPSTVLLEVTATSRSPQLARDIANAVAAQLGRRVEELETPRSGGRSPVKVTNAVPAIEPLAPVSPRLDLNLPLGALLGLALGALAAIWRDHRDTTVKTQEHVAALSGAAPMGVVRHDPGLKRQALLDHERGGGIVEEFRSIRTALRYVDVDNPPRQMVVCSSIAGEGKTIVACNLALAMAQSGSRVCLVEGDLRRPRVASSLGIYAQLGFTDVLVGQHDLADVLVPWNRGRISVLTAGTTPPDPSSLLGSRAAADVLAQLKREFDVVIIDAPPLLPVSDAAVLGALSDGVILVARYGVVKRDQVSTALNSLEAVNAHLIGTVLNGAPSAEREAHYGSDHEGHRLPTRAPALGDAGPYRGDAGRDEDPQELLATDAARGRHTAH